MMKAAVWMAAILAGSSGALAQTTDQQLATTMPLEPPADPYWLTSPKLNRMCSPAGIFQYSFAQTGVPKSTRMETMFTKGTPLPDGLGPFTHVKMRATEWSDRLATATYSGPKMDENELSALVDALDKMFTAQGWTFLANPDDQPMYLLGATGTWTWTTETEGREGPAKLIVGLSNDYGQVTMGCSRSDLMRDLMQEAFGQVPEGIPRPQPEKFDFDDAAIDCKNPTVVEDIAKRIDNTELPALTRAIMRQSKYHERLAQWKSAKLEANGADKEKLLKIVMSALDSDGAAAFDAGLTKALSVADVTYEIIQHKEAGDVQSACEAYAKLNRLYLEIAEITKSQWATIDAGYEAEAARLGVDLSQ